MNTTRLTVGGFTQPSVARNLIDIPSNTDKGFSHRFLWTFPPPLFGKFENLGCVSQMFVDALGM